MCDFLTVMRWSCQASGLQYSSVWVLMRQCSTWAGSLAVLTKKNIQQLFLSELFLSEASDTLHCGIRSHAGGAAGQPSHVNVCPTLDTVVICVLYLRQPKPCVLHYSMNHGNALLGLWLNLAIIFKWGGRIYFFSFVFSFEIRYKVHFFCIKNQLYTKLWSMQNLLFILCCHIYHITASGFWKAFFMCWHDISTMVATLSEVREPGVFGEAENSVHAASLLLPPWWVLIAGNNSDYCS
jgi:hypothetical protein